MAQHVRPSGKRLGVKMNDGQKASPGMVIVRQRGMKVGLGKGVAAGRDHTIYSIEKGSISYIYFFSCLINRFCIFTINPNKTTISIIKSCIFIVLFEKHN